MVKWAMPVLLLVAATSAVRASAVAAEARYRIDFAATAGDEEEVSLSSSTPGELLALDHPLGKGEAKAQADYGLLRARARVDPDFIPGLLSFATAQAQFDDTLVITGSNTGATASATFSLRVTGTIEQPFYVSEVTGFASASASLFVGTDLGSGNDGDSYGPQGPEPIFAVYDQTYVVTVPFTVGQPITLSAQLGASAEADIIVNPDEEDFVANFFNQAVLLPIQLTGVNDPVAYSESGNTYGLPAGPNPASGQLIGLVLSKIGSDLQLSWNPSCLATDTDYEIYEGDLGSWASHDPYTCSTSGATSWPVTPRSTDSYYLVVPTNGFREGSYGQNSFGPRPPSTSICRVQQVAGCP